MRNGKQNIDKHLFCKLGARVRRIWNEMFLLDEYEQSNRFRMQDDTTTSITTSSTGSFMTNRFGGYNKSVIAVTIPTTLKK